MRYYRGHRSESDHGQVGAVGQVGEYLVGLPSSRMLPSTAFAEERGGQDGQDEDG